MLSTKNEELLTEITQRFFLAAEKERLNKGVVNQAISDLKYIFLKDAEKKEDWCLLDSFGKTISADSYQERLENHHIAGRHSNVCVTIHVSHHIRISLRQLFWDSRWNRVFDSENLNISFLMEGLKEILVEKSLCTGINDYALLGYSLAPLVKRYREMA